MEQLRNLAREVIEAEQMAVEQQIAHRFKEHEDLVHRVKEIEAEVFELSGRRESLAHTVSILTDDEEPYPTNIIIMAEVFKR